MIQQSMNETELKRREYAFEMAKLLLGIPQRVPSANLSLPIQRLLFKLQDKTVEYQHAAEAADSAIHCPVDYSFLEKYGI